jgi:hypothetical protein
MPPWWEEARSAITGSASRAAPMPRLENWEARIADRRAKIAGPEPIDDGRRHGWLTARFGSLMSVTAKLAIASGDKERSDESFRERRHPHYVLLDRPQCHWRSVTEEPTVGSACARDHHFSRSRREGSSFGTVCASRGKTFEVTFARLHALTSRLGLFGRQAILAMSECDSLPP